MRSSPLYVIVIVVATVLAAAGARAENWEFKKQLLPLLAAKVPEILKSQDAKTGRFGNGVFIVRDQEPILSLAVAWATKGDGNPYYHDDAVLRSIIAGGDALITAQKPNGVFVFRKKDGSEWGDIYMPWTYSRWIRAFALVRDAMPADARERWTRALNLGYEGIVKTELVKPVENITAHDAMGLHVAGKTLNHPEWCNIAKAYMKHVIAAQHPDGYWSEHEGPVINYGFVYVEAVGAYYAISHDADVLPALQSAARFHAAFVYPDGRSIETIDERNPYSAVVTVPGFGFTFSQAGRTWAKGMIDPRLPDNSFSADFLAGYILYGEEGAVDSAPTTGTTRFITRDGQACTVRDGPWFACITSYHAPVSDKRWIQDRQNFFSLFHDGDHVIIGGGNTKLQPLWSTFTVGDPALLKHTPGDENPNFLPPPGILHVPSDASLDPAHNRIDLTCGDVKCAVTIDITNPASAKVVYQLLTPTDQRVEAHVTLVPEMKARWRTASGKQGKLTAEEIHLAAGEAGDWFSLGDWKITVPPQATLTWPALPHNPYTKDGHAEASEGRIVMSLPLSGETRRYELELTSVGH